MTATSGKLIIASLHFQMMMSAQLFLHVQNSLGGNT